MAGTPVYYFDPVAFRAGYTQFADETAYPDSLLQTYWDAGGAFIDNSNYGALASCQPLALNLITAHVAALLSPGDDDDGDVADTPGIVVSASIDKVSVTLQPPPAGNQFTYWLNQTKYGTQLAALLAVKGAGGFFTGGRPVRAGFRGTGVGGYCGSW